MQCRRTRPIAIGGRSRADGSHHASSDVFILAHFGVARIRPLEAFIKCAQRRVLRLDLAPDWVSCDMTCGNPNEAHGQKLRRWAMESIHSPARRLEIP